MAKFYSKLEQWFPQIFVRYDGALVKPPPTVVERQQWTKKWDFIMACVGYAVGLGNIWRFPYLCYKNGGGAFLIPYMVIAFTSGLPLFFLEIAVGQFLSQGCVTVWKLCPIFKGIGYGIVVLCMWLNVYYIVVLAWSIYYFGMSFYGVLPWSHCDNDWNTDFCSVGPNYTVFNTTFNETGNCSYASSIELCNITTNNVTTKLVDSVEEFWKHKILKMTDAIDNVGGMNYEMVGCLLAAWLLNYFIIWKGVKVSGKIVYFTALFPYFMLIVLLIRSVTLPGAIDGIIFYLEPNFTKLFESEVWMDAGTQIFFSYAVSTGALIGMGSYNKFNNDCYKDSWIICLVNSITSFFSGFCVFAVLGFMAHEQHKNVRDVVADGPGLAFVAYPKALSYMPGWPPIWAVLFFFMLILLGIDSEFVGLEGLFTALLDIYPQFRQGKRPEIVMATACALSFLLGLTMCTEGGMYVFQLFDYYSASGFVLLWFCFFECFAIAWVYGGQRFYEDIQTMIGYRIGRWMLFCWSVVAPATSLIIFIVSLVNHEPIKFGGYQYPAWADAMGWGLAISSMICVPGYFVYRWTISPGNNISEKWQAAITPDFEQEERPATLTTVRPETLSTAVLTTNGVELSKEDPRIIVLHGNNM